MHTINNTRISKLTNSEILLQTTPGSGLAIYNIADGRTSIMADDGSIGKDWAKRLIVCHLACFYLVKHARDFGDADTVRDEAQTGAMS